VIRSAGFILHTYVHTQLCMVFYMDLCKCEHAMLLDMKIGGQLLRSTVLRLCICVHAQLSPCQSKRAQVSRKHMYYLI